MVSTSKAIIKDIEFEFVPQKKKKHGTFGGRTISTTTTTEFDFPGFKTKVDTLILNHNISDEIALLKSNQKTVKKLLHTKDEDTIEQHEVVSALTRTLFEDIIGLSKKERKTMTQNEIENDMKLIDEGLSLLIETETSKEKKVSYLSILLNIFKETRDTKSIATIYKEQILPGIRNAPKNDIQKLIQTCPQNNSKQLLAWVKSCQNALPSVFKLKNQDRIQYETKMLTRLDPLLQNEVTKTAKTKGEKSISEKEQSEIEAFLLYAYANDNLNKRLRSKKPLTNAEEFISEYTHVTSIAKTTECILAPSTLEKNISDVRTFMKTSNLDTVLQDIKEIEKSEQHIFGCIKDPQNNLQEFPEVSSKLKVFVTLFKKSPKSIWELRRSGEMHKLGQDLLKTLEETQTRKDVSSHITSLHGYLNTYLKKIEKVAKSLDGLNPEKKLSPLVLRNIAIFCSFSKDIDQIADSLHNFSSPILQDFQRVTDKAFFIIHDLQSLSNAALDFQVGDVALKDERREKQFTGSTRPPLSQLEITNFKNFKFLINEILTTSNIFAIQPYFTGEKTHARMFFGASADHVFDVDVQKVRNKKRHLFLRQKLSGQDLLIFPERDTQGKSKYTTNIIQNFDVVSAGVRIQETSLESSWSEVTYRPDFDKIINDSVKTEYDKEKKDLAPIIKYAQDRYAKNIQMRVQGNSKWDTYKLDHGGALTSYLISKVPRVFGLKEFARNFFNFCYGLRGLFYNGLLSALRKASSPETLRSIFSNEHKRFCSQLTAEVMKEAFKVTEDELRTKYPKLKTPILKPVFPTEIQPYEFHPNMLKDLLAPYFTEVGRPSLLKAIFEDDIKKREQKL